MIILGIGPDWLTKDHEAETVSTGKNAVGSRREGHAGGGTESEKDSSHVWNSDLRMGEREGSCEEAVALRRGSSLPYAPAGSLSGMALHGTRSFSGELT
jgi:hypothetical protein